MLTGPVCDVPGDGNLAQPYCRDVLACILDCAAHHRTSSLSLLSTCAYYRDHKINIASSLLYTNYAVQLPHTRVSNTIKRITQPKLSHVAFGQLALFYEHSRRRSNLPLSPRFTIKPSRNPAYLGHSSSLLATCDMGDQSVWGHFRPPFESALQAYEMKTGVTLSKHPLVLQLQECHTVDSITTVLQDQARNFGDFQQNDRMTKTIKATVSILFTLSATAPLGESMGPVRQLTDCPFQI